MKYTILINQAGIVDAGLADKTDFSDWAILEYIVAWQSHSNAMRYGDHIWLNYKNLLSEIPMLCVRTKSGISTRIARLRDLKLLSTKQTDDNRLYVKVTDFYLSVVGFRPGDPVVNAVTPRPLKQAVGVHVDEHPVHVDEHPVHVDEHSINNNIKLLNQTKHYAGAQGGEKKPGDDQVFCEALQWAQFFIRECDYPMHIVQTAKTIPMFAQWVADRTTVGEIRQAMAACHGWNNGRIPDSPLLYGKFLQSVRDARSRMADEAAFEGRPGVGKQRNAEDWMRVPRGDEELWPWAKKHGYPDPGRLTYREYRAKLHSAVESRLAKSASG